MKQQEILRICNDKVIPADDMIASVEELISNSYKKFGEEGYSLIGYSTDAFGYCLVKEFETGSKTGKKLKVAVELIRIEIKEEDGHSVEVTYHSISKDRDTIWESQTVTLDYLKTNLYKWADFKDGKITLLKEKEEPKYGMEKYEEDNR